MPGINYSARRLRSKVRAVLIALTLASFGFANNTFACAPFQNQESVPAPPNDRSLIYVADASNALDPLPFETGTTPLKSGAVAERDKASYIELRGLNAKMSVRDPLARFYLFVSDEANVHPPFIVRLTEKRGARRVTAMTQKGLKGFAIYSEEIVKPRYRVLSRMNGVVYLEIQPREPLAPGEYAIIGADLNRIATFSVVAVLK